VEGVTCLIGDFSHVFDKIYERIEKLKVDVNFTERTNVNVPYQVMKKEILGRS
jgi:hypothetical protein